MAWILVGSFEEGKRMFAGSGWTDSTLEARTWDNPDDAQAMADGLHRADCGFNTDRARTAAPRFEVRHAGTGALYVPPPLVDNRYVFVRRKR